VIGLALGRQAAPLFGRIRLHSVLSGAIALGFVSATAILLSAGSGSIAKLIYLAGSVVLGAYFFFRDRDTYAALAFWFWFLTPFVRRIIDFQIGWSNLDPVMLAPFLFTSFSAIELIRRMPILFKKTCFPFLLILTGVTYGYLVGMVMAGPSSATYGLLTWFVPIAFGFYFAANPDSFEANRRVVTRAFLWGAVVMGIYSVHQFFFLQPWDKFWMLNVHMDSQGLPEPLHVRVFGTMNSSGPFATILMACLLLVLTSKGALRWPAAVAGVLAFGLSLVRAAWLGWVVGAIFLLFRLRTVSRLRLLMTTGLGGLVLIAIVSGGPIEKVFEERFETFTAMEQDYSYQARATFYREFILHSLTNALGAGIGTTGLSLKLSEGETRGYMYYFDSGIMEITYVLGWPGALLFFVGIITFLPKLKTSGTSESAVFVHTASAIAVGLAIQLVFVNTVTGVTGVVFWSFLGLALAGNTSLRARALQDARAVQPS
jgi:hypothetical protein